MAEVTLSLMLKARDERAALQKELIDRYNCPLICFTMNIAGPVKTSPIIERAFKEGVSFLLEKLPEDKIVYQSTNMQTTGCEAMLCVAEDASHLKNICTSIEDSCTLGRLFDMDVIDTDFTKLSRNHMRGCIVCKAPGRECAAGRVHSVSELQNATSEIIHSYFLDTDSTRLAALAAESLLDEVYTTPKPGLVDLRNNGSHSDMDVQTFVRSAEALKGYFKKCIIIGYESSGNEPGDTFRLLRNEGIEAEKTMYRATGGANTHKGAIYSLGLICGAIGRLRTTEIPVASLKEILYVASCMAEEALKTDFISGDLSTAGKRLYHEYGLTGIRGEAAGGFSTVTETALPVYKKCIENDISSRDAGAVTLIYLIAYTQDTNLYRRGGKDGALYASNAAKELIQKYTYPPKSEIERLDDEFIKRNLSPGGCADLLAVTYFLKKLF